MLTPRLPPNCNSFLPAGFAIPPGDPETFLSIRITIVGEMRDPSLIKSSGDAKLDNAALACANGYPWGPDRVGDKPTDVTSEVRIPWRADRSGFSDRSGDLSGHCERRRLFSQRFNAVGTTMLSYRIATDGTVKDLKITQTSGNRYLDDAATECVATWQFFPAQQNGQPAEIDRQLAINWQMQ